MSPSESRSGKVLVERRGRVLVVTLDRPEKLNAMTPQMVDELYEAFESGRNNDEVHCLVLRGNGRAFSSGADLKASQGGARHRANAPRDMAQNRARVQGLLKLWSFPKPWIVQVHGYCLGIATEIAGCADMIVCGDSARFGMPEAREFALPPTLAFWPQSIGIARTKDLLLTGRLLDGSEAVAAGLAARLVPDAELEATVLQLAEHIAEVPIDRLAVIKQSVNQWVEGTLVPASLRGAEYHALYHQASEPLPDR